MAVVAMIPSARDTTASSGEPGIPRQTADPEPNVAPELLDPLHDFLRALFVPQSDHRVHAHRAPRGQVAGDERDAGKQRRHRRERRQVQRPTSTKNVESVRVTAAASARPQTIPRMTSTLPWRSTRPRTAAGRGSQRDTDAHLPGAAGSRHTRRRRTRRPPPTTGRAFPSPRLHRPDVEHQVAHASFDDLLHRHQVGDRHVGIERLESRARRAAPATPAAPPSASYTIAHVERILRDREIHVRQLSFERPRRTCCRAPRRRLPRAIPQVRGTIRRLPIGSSPGHIWRASVSLTMMTVRGLTACPAR